MAEDWARPVVHWEIQAREPAVQREFYSKLFNWEIGEGAVMMIPAGIGGPEPGPGGHIRQGEQPGFSLYVQVLDLRASMANAGELGGGVFMEPVDVPTGATIAGIVDP